MITYEIPDNWLPTSENINALPEPVRKYVHDLHTLADPGYIIQENVLVKDENRMLRALVEELTSEHTG